jgi:Ca-activated chloride channel family protein
VKVSAAALEAAREYLGRLEARGGTALDAALVEALRQPHEPGTLPLVLFMTDGLPTVGTSAEAEIRAHAEKLNLHQRRIFTLGVGFDVNAPLLDRLADTTRAVGTFVHPSEDVAVKVAALAKRLHGPLLAAPSLTVLDESGAPAPQRVRELEPALMPDVFRGDQIVVLGRYTGEDPLTFEIGGLAGGIQRSWRMSFELDRASVANAFVPRLWASRRIDRLIEELRQAGAVPGQVADPRSAELSAEILALSTEFGILTEATSFLALEGTDLGQPAAVLAQLQASFREKVQQVRSGRAGVANSANHALASRQQVTNRLNRHYDQQLNQVEVAQVAQVADRAFFQRNGAWVDSRLVARDRSAPADRTIAFGSPEHRELAARLQSEGRQGILALDGNVLVELDGQAVLVRGPAAAVATGG